jgi:serine/threonine-protein kinase
VEALAPGTIIDRYRVAEEIGSGSMGDVVRGEDIDLKRQVAIKILSERHRENKELRARFVREARAVAAISHPNVVQVFTTGSYDDRPYIAMELLKGVDLGSVVKENGVMSSIQAARAVLDSALGLDAAKKAGLIHRDVKPSNLVLLEEGQVKVTDFGLAKPLDPSTEPALTAMGVVVGTPDYIAPEQARGDPIDERVDIYALGGTLYYLLTGTPPFRKGNPVDDKYLKVVARHLKDPVPNARSKNRSADRELARLCKQMMAKKADDRPNYPELIEQLRAIIARLERGGASASLPAVSADSGPRFPAPTPFVGSAISGRRRRESTGAGSTVSTAPASLAPRSIGPGQHPSAPPVLDESAETLVRANRPPNEVHVSLGPIHKPRRAGWLIAMTVICALVFLTGLGLMLFGPIPEAEPSAGQPGADAAAVATPTADAAPPPVIEVPKGMLLVKKAGGEPWFLVDARPVSYGEYADLFPARKEPVRGSRAKKPVIKLPFDHAVSYAEATKKRLLSPDEWLAASKTEGFEGGELWEWVDDGTRGSQAKRSVRQLPDKLTRRQPVGHDDVTFRCARDL